MNDNDKDILTAKMIKSLARTCGPVTIEVGPRKGGTCSVSAGLDGEFYGESKFLHGAAKAALAASLAPSEEADAVKRAREVYADACRDD